MKQTAIIVLLFIGISFDLCTSYSNLNNDLKTYVQLLASKASNKEIELKQQNRTREINLIQVYLTRVVNLTEKLDSTTNETEINQMQHSLSNAISYLLMAFDRVSAPSYDFEMIKLAVIIRGEEILEKADEELKILEQKNDTKNASFLSSDMKVIQQLVDEVRNKTLMFDVYNIELNLLRHVTKMEIDLYALGDLSWDLDNTRHMLLERSYLLSMHLTDVINKMKNEMRFQENQLNDLITYLDQENKNMEDIRNQLMNATDKTSIAELNFKLSAIEFIVESEIAFFGNGTIGAQERQSLLNAIKELSSNVLVNAKALVERGMKYKAELIYNKEASLTDLYVAVRNINNPFEMFYLELRFRQIEHEFKYFDSFIESLRQELQTI